MNFTNIFSAAEKGTIEDIKYFLNDKMLNINTKDANGSLLHYAAGNNNLEVVKYLVSNGADINANGCFDETPLHWAARNENNIDVAVFLVQNGAIINLKANDEDGKYTPLHLAKYIKNNKFIELIISKGVIDEPEENSLPLHVIARRSLSKCGFSNHTEVFTLDAILNWHGRRIKLAGGNEYVICDTIRKPDRVFCLAINITVVEDSNYTLLEMWLSNEGKLIAKENNDQAILTEYFKNILSEKINPR